MSQITELNALYNDIQERQCTPCEKGWDECLECPTQALLWEVERAMEGL